MTDREWLTEQLKDRRWKVVADACGLSYNSVRKVADGGDDVQQSTIVKLLEYFGGRA